MMVRQAGHFMTNCDEGGKICRIALKKQSFGVKTGKFLAHSKILANFAANCQLIN